MTGPLLIVADDHEMATYYAREHDLGPEGECGGWIYAVRPRTVQGRQPGRYVHITRGELRLRDLFDRRDVLAVLRMHGFTQVTHEMGDDQ